MVQITISAITPSTTPADGWRVEYRKKGTTGAYITATGSPFSSLPIVFTTTDAGGTLYEIRIWRDCGVLTSTKFTAITACDCTGAGAGYVVSTDGSLCVKTTTIPATVTQSNYCLAPTGRAEYSSYLSRIYNPGYDYSHLFLVPASTNPFIYGTMSINPQWANTTASVTQGPMNRRAVWVDSDCDGNKDPLGIGVQATLSFMYNNTGATKQAFIGIAADNNFRVVVNGIEQVDTADWGFTSDLQFKIFHIIPFTLINGMNYVNAIATGDGSVNDAIAVVGFNNTAAQIKAATTDTALNIIFDSVNLRGTHFDVATCPPDYSLDASGGTGNYTCVRRETAICNKA